MDEHGRPTCPTNAGHKKTGRPGGQAGLTGLDEPRGLKSANICLTQDSNMWLKFSGIELYAVVHSYDSRLDAELLYAAAI